MKSFEYSPELRRQQSTLGASTIESPRHLLSNPRAIYFESPRLYFESPRQRPRGPCLVVEHAL
ncbi:hypothetical protein Lbir_0012 [Legionella birminghamensis]|uniref:Uncharacterized protein n=1 Tax=Legionella birminghamensis TaxID=28083 RepID=A0A378IA65_9GAMM|nr:hypothetical protein Lbir_0012 [Legionella birminghamensis]STX32069.1 Uncharacterised protein [Legionella birminghamensis]